MKRSTARNFREHHSSRKAAKQAAKAPATTKQRRFLRVLGYEGDLEVLTSGAAAGHIDRLLKKRRNRRYR